MNKRKKSPDILGPLMSGTIEDGNKEIKLGLDKEKATFNLSTNLLQKLEDTWMLIRKEFKPKKISKTSIVEAALELILEDFENKKQASKLYSILSKED